MQAIGQIPIVSIHTEPPRADARVEGFTVHVGTPLESGGAFRAAVLKALAELGSAGVGRFAAAPAVTAMAQASPAAVLGLSVALLAVAGAPACFYAGKQIREGTGGGWPAQALFTLAAVLPLIDALTCENQQERSESLAAAVGVLLSCAIRDLLNAVVRRSYGRSVSVDDDGFALGPREALAVRSGAQAVVPFLMNTSLALAGMARLAPALEQVNAELGPALSDTLVRAGWTAPLEAWRFLSGPVGYVPGDGCSAIRDNLHDWQDTLGHGAMNSSQRYVLKLLSTVPRIIGRLVPEAKEAMEYMEAGLQGAAEFRGFVVEKYEASRMDLA